MSVVSHKINPHRYRSGMSTRGPRSVIGGGCDVDQTSYLLPHHHFSALKSEGMVKMNMPDDWGENTTVVTSEQSFGAPYMERTSTKPKIVRRPKRSCCSVCSSGLLFLFLACLVLSAAAMTIIPVFLVKADFYETKEIDCQLDCTTNNFVICIFTVVLAYAVWATMKPTNAVLPRVRFRRIAFIFFLVFILASFWLFYIVQALLRDTIEYDVIQKLAMTMLMVLIMLQLLWVTADSFRRLKKLRVIVTRDPDGEVHELQISQNSLQEATVEILQKYETNFSYFNTYSDRCRPGGNHKSAIMSAAGFKMYDIDGTGDQGLDEDAIKKMVEVAAKQSAALSNDYSVEESDKERKTKRRRNRLLLSAEEAFTQINSINKNYNSRDIASLESGKSASIVNGAINKHLHRFLRHTHQQADFSPKIISHNLEQCFRYGFSARTFLSRFFNKQRPVNDQTQSKWTIISDRIVTQQIEEGLEFVIRCLDEEGGRVQLHCVVTTFPFYNITESHNGLNN